MGDNKGQWPISGANTEAHSTVRSLSCGEGLSDTQWDSTTIETELLLKYAVG